MRARADLDNNPTGLRGDRFEGHSVDEIERALAESIDDYLAMCTEDGVATEKPL